MVWSLKEWPLVRVCREESLLFLMVRIIVVVKATAF